MQILKRFQSRQDKTLVSLVQSKDYEGIQECMKDGFLPTKALYEAAKRNDERAMRILTQSMSKYFFKAEIMPITDIKISIVNFKNKSTDILLKACAQQLSDSKLNQVINECIKDDYVHSCEICAEYGRLNTNMLETALVCQSKRTVDYLLDKEGMDPCSHMCVDTWPFTPIEPKWTTPAHILAEQSNYWGIKRIKNHIDAQGGPTHIKDANNNSILDVSTSQRINEIFDIKN